MGELRRVLMTGANGVIGGVIRSRLADKYRFSYLDRRGPSGDLGDISDLETIRPAFEGMDAVIHLAAVTSVEASWDEVLATNIVGTYNVFEAARRATVKRVVFASSNHAVGMYEVERAPEIYALDDPHVHDATVPVRPDSLYGASKVFGETIGRLYADLHGLDVICLRIGQVREDDDPTLAVAGRPFEPLPVLTLDQSRQRLRAVWLSHRDCAQLIQRALDADVHWAIVYGVSNNPGRFWDLDSARDLIGYDPQDSAPT